MTCSSRTPGIPQANSLKALNKQKGGWLLNSLLFFYGMMPSTQSAVLPGNRQLAIGISYENFRFQIFDCRFNRISQIANLLDLQIEAPPLVET